jgi:MFS family permease
MPRIAVDLSVLRDSRNLRLLILGEVFSSLGAQAALVAIPYQIFTLTHSAALVGLLGLVELIPIVACSLLAGAMADRIERRKMMFTAQAVIFTAAALLAVGGFAGHPPVAVVYLLAGLLAAGSTIDNVTRSAIVPALAGDRLRAALSLNYGLYQVAAVVGPALGGLMIATLGVGAAFAADAGGFLIMVGVTMALPPLPPGAGADAEHPPILRSIAEGLGFVRRNHALMGSFAIDLVAMTFGMPRALFAVLALTVYDAGAGGTGLLYAAVSAGASVAALTTGWVEHVNRLGRVVIGAVIAWGLAIAAAGLMPSLWPAAVCLAVAGAADSVSAVCRSIINQTTTPEELRGRMSAIFMLVVTSGPRLGDLESGVAASLTTVGVAVVSGGLACVAGVFAIVLAFPALAAYDGRQADPV